MMELELVKAPTSGSEEVIEDVKWSCVDLVAKGGPVLHFGDTTNQPSEAQTSSNQDPDVLGDSHEESEGWRS